MNDKYTEILVLVTNKMRTHYALEREVEEWMNRPNIFLKDCKSPNELIHEGKGQLVIDFIKIYLEK